MFVKCIAYGQPSIKALPLRIGLVNGPLASSNYSDWNFSGSEAISRAQTEGQSKLEGSNINRSLLALSKVISQIVQRQQSRNNREDANGNYAVGVLIGSKALQQKENQQY